MKPQSLDSSTLVDQIIQWENDEMTPQQEIQFFQTLVDSGLAWSLQGTYGRRAEQLIREGLIRTTT